MRTTLLVLLAMVSLLGAAVILHGTVDVTGAEKLAEAQVRVARRIEASKVGDKLAVGGGDDALLRVSPLE